MYNCLPPVFVCHCVWPALLICFEMHVHNLHVRDRHMQHLCQDVNACVVMSGREFVGYVRVVTKQISNVGQTT
jgi:hypothetical protein